MLVVFENIFFGKLFEVVENVTIYESALVWLVLENFVSVENLKRKHLHVTENRYIFAIISISQIFL